MPHENVTEPIGLGRQVEFETSNGGKLLMVGIADSLIRTGITEDGWAFYDDLHINPHNEAILNVSDRHTSGTLRHITGDVIIQFNLSSRVVNGKTDVYVEDLAPYEWYRLEFDTVLAKTDSGRAHGQASKNGELIFTNVHIPN